jgi:hypothetical protein
MSGEPDEADVARARLVPQTCEGNERAWREVVDRRVERMRDQVDAEWKNWLSLPKCQSSFGSGGLGLTGIGEGGGGRGEGIGLGSIGTIGHGAGYGSAARHSVHSASGTNNQVEGVDEADLVKNDGRYVYLATHDALRIVDAASLRVVSVTKLAGDVRQMLLEGDRAVVFTASKRGGRPCTYGYDCTFAGDGSHTKMVVVDVADRARPRIVRQIELSGSLIAARRIGNAAHAVVSDNDNDEAEPYYETSPRDLPFCRKNEIDVRAKFDRLLRDNERTIRATRFTFPTITEKGASHKLCDAMHVPLADGVAFTTLVSFDMRDDRAPPVTATIESRPGAVFASENAFYVAVRHQRAGGGQRWYGFYGSENEVSDVHKFKIGGKPADTRYAGSGVFPGHVLNQFSMDEWYGYLRIATTRGRVPDPAVESAVSVLAETKSGNLVRVGAAEHIAPSEDIRAVRFDGDRGYVVTFKKTDPLFVLDLHHPAEPKILGELKIPGFSTYLHRIDPTHLISIGYDAQDHGDFAFFDGIILQMFDVTKSTEPQLLHKETIGTRGSSSEAATDHLAFNYFGERNLLALPMTVCEGGGDGRFGDRMTFSGLYVYEVTLEHGFRRLGGVDHGTKGARCTAWWSSAESAVKRSIFIDDFVYSIAADRMKVQRMDRFGEDLADIALTP